MLMARVAKPGTNLRGILDALLEQWRTTIEHLRTASDQVDEYQTWAKLAQHEYHALVVETDAFFDMIPVACVWTTVNGHIIKANDAAADLLAVSLKHLIGRTLNLHFEDRAAFSQMATTIATTGQSVEAPMSVKPRERRSVSVQLKGRSLSNGSVLVWFMERTADRFEPLMVHARPTTRQR